MKKILVAGGAGFVGSHLCNDLCMDENNFVYCVDNLSTGYTSNITSVSKNNNFHFIHHDIIQPINLLVDEIYNLASPASPPQYQKNPVFTMKTNVIGSMNLLELAHNVKAKILQASTSEIYGDPEVHPQVESYNGNVSPIGPRSCYDEGKRAAETLFFDYHRSFGVDIRVIRIFNTYGPQMDEFDGRVVSNFINQALRNENITIYGDGMQTRSFQYISDLIRGMKCVMSGDFTGPVNIGNPDEYTMLELAERIIYYSNSKSNLIYKDLPVDDPKRRKPDIRLAKNLYNWEPNIKLDDGLRITVGYFKDMKHRREMVSNENKPQGRYFYYSS